MAISTYADLKSAVAAWLDRADLTAKIPDFITLAEERIYNGPGALRVRAMESSVSVGALPSGFLAVRWAQIGTGNEARPLTYLTPEAYAGKSSGDWYSIIGGQIVTVAQNGTPAFYVYARLPALVNDNDTNWLLTNAPSVYLYGALLEAAVYQMDDAMAARYAPLFDQALRRTVQADAMVAPMQAQLIGVTVV